MPNVLAGKFQPYACAHSIAFGNYSRAKCLQRSTERLGFIVRNPRSTTSFEAKVLLQWKPGRS